MAVTLFGLTIGDDGSGWVVPTYAQVRLAVADRLKVLRDVANLHVEPGSFFGDLVDLAVTAVDLSLQASTEVVSRTIFTSMGGVALDQFLADYLVRVQASASTVTVWAYGAGGAVVPLNTLVRTSPTATAFQTSAAIPIPVAPAEAYAVEVLPFAQGAYAGQAFTVTVAGVPVQYVANAFDTGLSVRDGLITAINAEALLLTKDAWRGGQSPTSLRYALLVIEGGGGGVFTLSVAGPAGQIFAFPAASSPAAALDFGPVLAAAEALRFGPPFAGVTGYVNVEAAVPGTARETDSQFKARHQVAQRGLGGGSPDAVRAVVLASPEVGGGGATFCTVEYNPTEATDANGNVEHSLRAVVDQDADGQTVANAIWRAKAAGDNTNGPESYNVVDQQGNTQGPIRLDRLQDLWVGAEITVTVGSGWPNSGDPLAQLRADVTAYVEGLAAGKAVRVNLLPISTYTDGTPRGVVNFTVRVGPGPGPGGPFAWLDYYPTVEPNADLASVILTGRQKARMVITDCVAVIV